MSAPTTRDAARGEGVEVVSRAPRMARRAAAGGAALFAVSLFALGPRVTAAERDPKPAPSAPQWRSSPLAATAPVADCDSLVVPRDAENNTVDDPEHGVMLLESTDVATGAERRGLVVANRADFRSQHCYLAAVLEPGAAPTGWGMEALGLFISYLFESFNLRKIYFESLSFNLSQFASGIGRFFVEEGRLRGHDFYGGRWWDLHVMAIYREQWIERGAPLVAAEASQPRHPVIRVPAGGGHDSGHGGRDGL